METCGTLGFRPFLPTTPRLPVPQLASWGFQCTYIESGQQLEVLNVAALLFLGELLITYSDSQMPILMLLSCDTATPSTLVETSVK